MFIPCKSSWAVLTGLFFAIISFFAGNNVKAEIVQSINIDQDYTVIAEINFTGNVDALIYTFISGDASMLLSCDFYADDPNYFWTRTVNGAIETISQVDFLPGFNDSYFFTITRQGDLNQYYVNGNLYDTNTDDAMITGQLDLNDNGSELVNLSFFNNYMDRDQILDFIYNRNCATSTNCYIPKNNDIGIITGAVEKFENGATTTEFWTFKIPAILYGFIFSIVAVIIAILIAWIYKK